MSWMHRLAIMTGLAIVAAPTEAQVAFRIDLFHSQPVFSDRKVESFYGLGLDVAVTERTSMGFDVIAAWVSLTSAAGYKTEHATYKQFEIDYTASRTSYGIIHHSDFALGDNDRPHVYMGPIVGLMRAAATVEISSVYHRSTYDYLTAREAGLEERSNGGVLLVPIGLRLGLRGDLYSGHGDLYLGLGTNIGKERITSAPYLGTGLLTARSFLQFGVAVAFG